MNIDSHVHLWGQSVVDAEWLASPETAMLRKPFTLSDYESSIAALDIDSAIIVTAEQSTAESSRILTECAGSPRVAGVVGWMDLTDPDAAIDTRLVGIRHSTVSEAEGWLDRRDVEEGLRALTATGLALELLAGPRDLPAVARCATAHPDLRIVIDHLGNPPHDPEQWQEWRRDLIFFSPLDNVWVKLSGAGLSERSIAVALDAISVNRLVFGSDWPVSLLTVGLAEEMERFDFLTSSLSEPEREQVFGGSAIHAYGIT